MSSTRSESAFGEIRRPGAKVFWRTTLGGHSLSAAAQAVLVNNLNQGLAWGLLPLFYASAGLSLGDTRRWRR